MSAFCPLYTCGKPLAWYFLLDVMAVSVTFGPYVFYACSLDIVLLLARQLNCSEHGLRWNSSTPFFVEVTGLPQVVNSCGRYDRIVVSPDVMNELC